MQNQKEIGTVYNMRAKEFVIEAKIDKTRNEIKPIIKSLSKEVKDANKTQAIAPYKTKTFKSGKHGEPTGVHHYDLHNQTQNADEYGSERGDIPIEAQAAMPGAISISDLASDFYGVYRVGMAIAAGDLNVASADNFGKHPFVMPFAPEEHASVIKNIKRTGHKVKQRTTPQSLELSTNNVVSPVANKKRNKYGI